MGFLVTTIVCALWQLRSGHPKSDPVRARQRRVVLEYLAERFEKGKEYPEADVNELLGRFHDDYASLRRLLVDEGLLTRSGGRYRRS